MRLIFFCLIVAAIAVLAGVGAALAGDVDKGRDAAKACVSCHGADGISRFPDIPHLAGQNQAYLVAAMSAFRRSGLGKNLPGGRTTRSDMVMKHQAAGLTDGDIENLASYFSSLACPMVGAATSQNLPAVGQRCLSCHGQGGHGVTATVPRLAGQQQRYLENQLKAFRDARGAGSAGQRRMRIHLIMTRQAKPLTDDEIVELAGYFADQPCK